MDRFARTWWGKLWLNAFEGIDYLNRLPRGRSYANPNRVPQMYINNHVITAPVWGRRDFPYDVEISLPLFTEEQREEILGAVRHNPQVLGELINGTLPESIYSIASSKGIELLPESWDSMDGYCTCPDWAVPCKHLAAIVYLLANEIDKNPFLIFRLHGMNLVEEIERATDLKVQRVALAPNPLSQSSTTSEVLRPRGSAIDLLDLDLSVIPELGTSIFSLLDERPLFHNKDFKEILWAQYRRSAKWAVRYDSLVLDRTQQVWDYSGDTLVLDASGNFVGVFEDEVRVHESRERWIEDLGTVRSHGFETVNEGDAQTVFWYVLYRLALKLLEQQAYVPHVVSHDSGNSSICWRVTSLDQSVTTILEQFYEHCPSNLVAVQDDNGELRSLDRKSQVDVALNELIAYFVEKSYLQLRNDVREDEVQDWFFTDSIHRFEWFGTATTPILVQRWLNCLTLRDRRHRILIVVEEHELEDQEDLAETASSDIDQQVETDILISVSVKIEQGVNLYTIGELIDQAHSIPDSSTIFSDLAFLTSYFPDLEKLTRRAKGDSKQSIEYTLSDFAPVLLRCLPILKLLGTQLVMPKELDNLLRPKLSIKVKRSSPTTLTSYLGLEELVSFDWQVALGDTNISREEFMRLVESAKGLVRIKDRFVLIDENEVSAIAERMQDLPDSMSSLGLLRADLVGEFEDAGIEVDPAVRELLDSVTKREELAVPTQLDAQLRNYQHRGFEWLANNARMGLGSILADDMGLGKTIQVITLLLHQKEAGSLNDSGALIVLPTSLITNWRKEIERFAPILSVGIFHGSNRSIDAFDADVTLTSYGVVRSDIAKLQRRKFCTLVADEAQNIKNPLSQQTKAVKRLKAGTRIALSGTPVENRLLDYWSIFDFTISGYLGNQKKFNTTMAKPIELERDQECLGKFRKMTGPFILRRLKSDKTIIKDLPDKIESDRFCTLSKVQASIYQKTVDETMKLLEGAESHIERGGLVFKLITALKQICNSPSHYLKRNYTSVEESGKLSLFVDILGEALDADEKMIVFTQFAEMGKLLVDCIKSEFGMEPPFLYGGLSRKRRDEMVDSFQNYGRTRVMILSLKAGGTGLNLTAASQVVHYDLWWNPAVETQATDRAYRIGQDKNVHVQRLLTENTFEERINEMIQNKRSLAEMTVANGELSITDLSNDELRELVHLS